MCVRLLVAGEEEVCVWSCLWLMTEGDQKYVLGCLWLTTQEERVCILGGFVSGGGKRSSMYV